MTKRAGSELRLTVLGQALVGHDLRADPWPDFAALAEICGSADVCFTDLEITRSGFRRRRRRRGDGVFLHAADPAVLGCLQAMSVSMLATANNHVWDLGAGGIIGMLRELDGAASATPAPAMIWPRPRQPLTAKPRTARSHWWRWRAGRSARGRLRPTPGPDNELRLDPGGSPGAVDLARITAAIAAAAMRAEIVLAYHHNHILEDGGRHTPHWQRDFARRCIDAGASLYVSHGAPRLHGIEIYRGRPIFYGLGNFIFQTATEPGHYDDEVWHSVIAECRFHGDRFREMRLIPLQLTPPALAAPTISKPAAARRLPAAPPPIQSSPASPGYRSPLAPPSPAKATPPSSGLREWNLDRLDRRCEDGAREPPLAGCLHLPAGNC